MGFAATKKKKGAKKSLVGLQQYREEKRTKKNLKGSVTTKKAKK